MEMTNFWLVSDNVMVEYVCPKMWSYRYYRS
jgi:lipid A disaccharide synthetase